MRAKLLTLCLLVLLSTNSLSAGGKFAVVPPDEPENFFVRYRWFLDKKERKPIEHISKELGKLTKERDKYQSRRDKLNQEMSGLIEMLKGAANDKDRKRAENELAKKGIELAEVQLKLDALTPKIEAGISQLELLIDKFWADRDINPATPENEFKAAVDQRLDEVSDEIFFKELGSLGPKFSANDGLNGEMARVYLLHGPPNGFSTLENLPRIADLMLWVYLDNSGQSIRYAFLFYRKDGSSGAYRLFPQDAYASKPCLALYEAMRFQSGGTQAECDPSITAELLRELEMASGSDGTPGWFFGRAMVNFSQDPSIRQGTALLPPLSAREIVRQSPARVAGEAPKLSGTAGTDYILFSCTPCNSVISGVLRQHVYSVLIARNSLDWVVTPDGVLEAELKRWVVLERLDAPAVDPVILQGFIRLKSTRELLEQAPTEFLKPVTYLTVQEAEALPAGRYRISIYLKSMLTNRYYANVIEGFEKK